MEFLNKYKQTKKEDLIKRVQEDASNKYSIELFDDMLYYAYDGVPIIGIPSDTTAQEMTQRLKELIGNFVEYKSRNLKVNMFV